MLASSGTVADVATKENYGAIEAGTVVEPQIILEACDLDCATDTGFPLLTNVRCAFHPGKIAAVLGPSGAGKTSLFNTLSQRLPDGWLRSGWVAANGRKLGKDEFMEWGSVAPQDDVLLAGLTPRELIQFAARLRGCWMPVNEVLNSLELTGCADNMAKSLSGGQRRRTSLGLELVHGPSVLLCDEPTSGLDSRSARLVIEKLAAVARTTRTTVVATIHQPSSDLFSLFDTVVVLCGGKVAYAESSVYFKSYFEKQLRDHQKTNPCDVVLDYVALNPNVAANAWSDSELARSAELLPLTEQKQKLRPFERPSFVTRIIVLTHRTALNLLREQGPIQLKAAIVVGIFNGILFYREQDTQNRGQLLLGANFITVVFNSVSISMTTITVVPTEIPTLRREYFNGIYKTIDYLASRLLVTLVLLAFVAAAYSTTFFHLAKRGFSGGNNHARDFSRFYITLYLLDLIVSILGFFVGAVAPNGGVANVLLLPFLIPFLMNAGYFFQLNDLTKAVQIVDYPLWFLSYARYSFALLISCFFLDGRFEECDENDFCPFSSYVDDDEEKGVKHDVVLKDYLDIPVGQLIPLYIFILCGFILGGMFLSFLGTAYVALRFNN